MHEVQVVEPWFPCWKPGAHCVHMVDEADEAYVPVLQRPHTVALDSDANVPAAHWVHCVDAVVVALVPGVQRVQMVRPVSEV